MPGPPKSRLVEIDPNSKDYTVIDSKTGKYTYGPLPRVELSFVEPGDDIYFAQNAIYSNAFSSAIQAMFTTEMPNVITKFVARGKGWDGPRFVPIKFVKGDEPCYKPITWQYPEETHLDTMYLQARKYDLKNENWRRGETLAINAVTTHLPVSTREVTLLHWICHWPGLWKDTHVMDVFYANQWVDTHSHPAWYYPGAATINGYKILLKIRAPQHTPMMRIRRHSSYQHKVNKLKTGEWTHTEYDPHETEVRLPPGRYVVEMPPTFELYAGKKILLVKLIYEPFEFRQCETLIQRLSGRRKR